MRNEKNTGSHFCGRKGDIAMEKSYKLVQLSSDADIFAAAESGERAAICEYRWQSDYTPRAEAYVAVSEDALRVCLTAWGEKMRAEGGARNDMVCLDSCLEFFFAPIPGSLAYFNFEFNPHGTMYVGFSPAGTRESSEKITDAPDNAYFRVETRQTLGRGADSRWQVGFDIPFAFIRRFVPGFDIYRNGGIRGNFYKCGDKTEIPHWGSWNLIGTEGPDFHRPEYFGEISLCE